MNPRRCCNEYKSLSKQRTYAKNKTWLYCASVPQSVRFSIKCEWFLHQQNPVYVTILPCHVFIMLKNWLYWVSPFGKRTFGWSISSSFYNTVRFYVNMLVRLKWYWNVMDSCGELLCTYIPQTIKTYWTGSRGSNETVACSTIQSPLVTHYSKQTNVIHPIYPF